MESKALVLAKKRARQEEIKANVEKHSRFNFGTRGKGVLTSTSNPKAHSFNRFDRERMEKHNQNVDKMVEDFNNGIVSDSKPTRTSKTAKRYNQRIRSKIENFKIKNTFDILEELFSALEVKSNILDAR